MNPHASSALRRTVLALALGLAIVVSGMWKPHLAVAQPAAGKSSATAQAPGGKPAASAAAPAHDAAGSGTAATSSGTSATTASATDSTDSSATSEAKDEPPSEIVIEKNGKRVRIKGLRKSSDPDLAEFNHFLEKQPEFAGMVVAIVAIIFLAPVLIVGLVISYRMRKARLLNETMLKLAERGVLAPAEAMQALSTGQLPPSMNEPTGTTSGAAAAPSLLDQARQIRARAAWSDLRKGILVGAIGLAFTVHELWRYGRPGTIGLILLFIGVGYCVLWWYETRQISPPRTGAGTPGSGT